MSLLDKSHVGIAIHFPTIEHVVRERGEWAKYGYLIDPQVGFDERGYYVDICWIRDENKTYRTEDDRIYYARRHCDYLDFDYDRRKYNDYRMRYEGGTNLCPFFRYRNIYGNLYFDGVQNLKNLDFIDHIHGGIILDDMYHEFTIPNDLVLDGDIRIITRSCGSELKNWKHLREDFRQKLVYL